MVRKTTSKSTEKTTDETAEKAAETRRVTSLEPKAGKVLTSLEEAVVRMHHGVSVKADAELATNGTTDELMGQMFEMEVRAHVESGRIDDLPDVPPRSTQGPAADEKNARTQKVVAALKNKT